jgi:uncharacterized paraquat-inducible protein A
MSEDLQFRTAEPVAEPDHAPQCVACSRTITSEYFHAQGQVVCPECAAKIEAGTQSPPTVSIATAVLYGSLAALAGLIIYALTAIVANLEIGLIAILVGIMVGKAVRAGSKGLGGRAQQLLAVALTYASISISHVPVFIWHYSQKKPATTDVTQGQPQPGAGSSKGDASVAQSQNSQPIGFGRVVLFLMLIGLASPFMQVWLQPASGLISLLILFFGLSRAWALTGRSDILIMGPYKVESVS